MPSETKRVTITMPKKLLDEIRMHSTNVSGFLSEAAAERLSRERYLQSVSNSAGAWKPNAHPDLETVDDVISYVDSLRNGWNRAD